MAFSGGAGEDIGIISGADVIALRKVEVESTDYAFREYGATSEDMKRFEKQAEKRYQQQSRSGKLARLNSNKLKQLLEEATAH